MSFGRAEGGVAVAKTSTPPSRIKYHYNWSETTGSTTKWKLRSVYVFFGQPDAPKLGTNTGSKYEHEQMYHVNMVSGDQRSCLVTEI